MRPTKRPLDLSGIRPVHESVQETSPKEVLKKLMEIPVGKSLKTDIGDIERTSEDDFRIKVSPEHFRRVFDNILN